MFASGNCSETVSILEAMVFGSNGACIGLGMVSVLTAVLALCVLVVLLKVLGKVTLFALFGGLRIAARDPEYYAAFEAPALSDPSSRFGIGSMADDGGPIRSSGA